jgi:hypothetical protein
MSSTTKPALANTGRREIVATGGVGCCSGMLTLSTRDDRNDTRRGERGSDDPTVQPHLSTPHAARWSVGGVAHMTPTAGPLVWTACAHRDEHRISAKAA